MIASPAFGSLSIIQFASEVLGVSSQYGSGAENVGISYSSLNLIGRPTVYPVYGDAMQTFSFRHYGHWPNKDPFNKLPSQCLKNCPKVSGCYIQNQDFIDVKYEIKVYPYEVNVYETYNPGALNTIYGFEENSLEWFLLWRRTEKENASVLNESRIFSPPLIRHDFKTNRLLLEFNQADLDYYYQMDAVALVGSIFRNTISSSHIQPVSSYNQNIDYVKNEDSMSMKENYFLQLPYEICHKVLSYLDLASLCRAARVCRSFKSLCYDATLYKILNLQPYCTKINVCALHFLSQRLDFASHLRWLNLSWCRNVSQQGFCSFIERGILAKPGTLPVLSCLRLARCTFVSDSSLRYIAQELVNLKELNISGCTKVETDHAFEKISLLVNLEVLCLSDTLIRDRPLIKILRNCKKLKHLSIGNCWNISSHDNVVFELEPNSGLVTLDLWRGMKLTPDGLSHIAEMCSSLENLDIGWCFRLESSSGCIQNLIAKCGVKLRKLMLTSIRSLRDDDLWLISKFCPYLEQLDVSGTREITEKPIEEILNNCRVLCLLDVSFSLQISVNKVAEWRHSFPLVQIKKSTPKPIIAMQMAS